MFHALEGQVQPVKTSSSSHLVVEDTINDDDVSNRISAVDFAKLEPLNPNGYMLVPPFSTSNI
jgi:hypothetical protein